MSANALLKYPHLVYRFTRIDAGHVTPHPPPPRCEKLLAEWHLSFTVYTCILYLTVKLYLLPFREKIKGV